MTGYSPESFHQEPSDVLVEELLAHVERWLGNRLSDFRVSFQAGGLVLKGRADSLHAKQLVQQAVIESTDLPIVANEIRARGEHSATR